MRKVCFIIDSLTGGGAECFVITLAGEMMRKGLDVHIITLSDICNYTLNGRIHYHTLSGSPKKSWAKRDLAGKLRVLVHSLEKDSPFDLIVASLLRSNEIVKIAGLRGVYHCINNPLEDQIKHTRSRSVKGWWHAKLRRLYNHEHLIAVSHGVARNLTERLRINPASISVIYNGFDFDEIRRQSEMPERIADSLRPFVLYVGHFKRQKRTDLLLEAWALARPAHKLVFLGKGSPRKIRRIEAQSRRLGIAGNVVLAGWHENPYSWMKRADLLVLSSDFEGFGRVLVEALSTGTPVVSTNCPSGPSEILTGSLGEWLVPKNNPEALAEKIRLALESSPLIDKTMVEGFSIDRIVAQYLSLTPRRKLLLTEDTGCRDIEKKRLWVLP